MSSGESQQEQLFCYNRGCQKMVSPDSLSDTNACVHHPGLPYFHDGYQIWTCCQKKTREFTDFLSIRGCTRSAHQITKPEPVKPTVERTEEAPARVVRPVEPTPTPPPPIERPAPDAPLTTLTPKIASSLTTQLASLAPPSTEKPEDEKLTPGTKCKHNSCDAVYQGEGQEGDGAPCRYHPGVAIFHEGIKFWTCCQKRTSDWDAFRAQPGCTESETHKWLRTAEDKMEDENVKSSCRADFHQQGSFVVFTLYAKLARPEKTLVQLNPGRLRVETVFDKEGKKYANEWELYGLVDVAKSTVELMGTKIEITLRKAEPLSWPRLDLPPQA